jgi:hypothetical protein
VQDILPNMYAIAVTALALSLPSNALHLGPAGTLLQQYGIVGELISAGAVAVVFLTAIAALEWRFLVECWKKVR